MRSRSHFAYRYRRGKGIGGYDHKTVGSKCESSQPVFDTANFSPEHSELKRRMIMIAKFNKQSLKWSAVGLVLFLLLIAVSSEALPGGIYPAI